MEPVMGRIFISLRFDEATNEAKFLKGELERHGVVCFLCDVSPGGSIRDTIVKGLSACELVVIMGTRTYGKDTGVSFCTKNELDFIIDRKKPFFLIKMCDNFEEDVTCFHLPSHISHHRWDPGTPAPRGLVESILNKLQSLHSSDAISSATPTPTPTSTSALSKSHSVDHITDKSITPALRKTLASGAVYEGDGSNGRAHGRGTLTYPNGDRFVGLFEGGKRQGQGTYFFSNGDRFEGVYSQGKASGPGKLFYSDGHRFEGEFSDDKANGPGTEYFADGSRLEGVYRENRLHGRVVGVRPDGSRREEIWRDGERLIM
eukprot:m.233595 g.233595  ORF g.233595 m.233595 type:complete len:317 (-) comp19220_c0_seq1:27-977(-)